MIDALRPSQQGSASPVRRRLVPPVVMLVFTLAAPFTLANTEYYAILTLAAIFGIVAVSLDLLLGYAGLLSLGQTVPFGVAAYTSAVLTSTHGLRPELAAVAAVAAAIAVAVVASPILRLEGFYFALATLGLVLIFEAVSRNWLSVTGGSSGFVGIEPLTLGPLTLRSATANFLLAWLCLTAVTLVAVNVTRSRFGRGMLAIHEDPRAASALGVSVSSVKIRIWIFAAGMSGVAGVLYCHYLRFLSPEQFGQTPAIVLVAAIVIGGTGTVYGPVVGVVVVRMLPALFDGFQERSVLVYGTAIILFTVLWPRGLVGAATDVVKRIRSARAARSAGSSGR
ncbi:MAG: branched-chain amino acid ABC transporter permease [Acidimicrobiales bacterium]